MKLLRVGIKGKEKPATLDKNNKIRDYFYKRLIFPIIDIQGRVIGFGGRALDNSNPKYINSPESKIFQKRYLLYNLNLAKNIARKKNNLLINFCLNLGWTNCNV